MLESVIIGCSWFLFSFYWNYFAAKTVVAHGMVNRETVEKDSKYKNVKLIVNHTLLIWLIRWLVLVLIKKSGWNIAMKYVNNVVCWYSMIFTFFLTILLHYILFWRWIMTPNSFLTGTIVAACESWKCITTATFCHNDTVISSCGSGVCYRQQ